MIGNAITRGLVIGLAASMLVLACASRGGNAVVEPPPPGPQPPVTPQMLKEWNDRNRIDLLWVQIRTWRHEGDMEVDPPQALQLQFRNRGTVKDARRVCPEDHQPPKVTKCEDMCTLADAICENAETICEIADSLGRNDPSQEKCTSAKASCREAKQRCCDCKPSPNGNTPGNP